MKICFEFQVATSGVKPIESQDIDQRSLQEVNTGTKHLQKASDDGNEHGINEHILSSLVRETHGVCAGALARPPMEKTLPLQRLARTLNVSFNNEMLGHPNNTSAPVGGTSCARSWPDTGLLQSRVALPRTNQWCCLASAASSD